MSALITTVATVRRTMSGVGGIGGSAMDATAPDRRGRGARWPEPLGYPPCRDTISAIQIGAYGDVQPRGVG